MLGALASLVLAIVLVAGFDPAAAGLQDVVDQSWIPQLGVRFQLGVDGISIFLVLLTALLWAAATCGRRCRCRTGRATTSSCSGSARPRRSALPRSGPAPLRPLLRPDARAALLPDRRLGHRRPGPRDDQDDRLHARRLAPDAGRGDRDRGPQRRRGRRRHLLDRDPAPGARSPTARQYWIFCFFAAAFLVKMPAFLVHGWMSTPTAPVRCRSWSCSGACSRRSPPTASCES